MTWLLTYFFPGMLADKARQISKWGLGLLLVIVSVVGFIIWLNRVKSEAVQVERDRVEALGSKARETATEERVTDTANNAVIEKGLHDAITQAPKDGTVSPAAHALNCQRLRNIGRVSPDC